MLKSIFVLGSSNVDLIFKIARFHQPGETIFCEDWLTAFGGKGANQAISAKRLYGNVTFLTKLGNDDYGQSYRQYLIENGLPKRWILREDSLPTGIALIELDPKGENRIIVFRGANGSLSTKDLERASHLLKTARIFVSQLEIPIATVKMGLSIAKKYGVLTLLNPSPPTPLSSKILLLVDYLVLNELEAQALTGKKIQKERDLSKVAKRLLEKGVKNVVITLGSKGLYFKNREQEIRMKAFSVKAVDTTAAGDAFMGALACGLAEGKTIEEVLRFASASGAIATTKLGAQPSLPYRKEIFRFLRRNDLPL